MNYKQKKYFRQNLDFNTVISNADFFFVFQFKAVNIFKWTSFKKDLLKYGLKSKVFSIKSFQKNNFFNLKSNLIKNMYNGKLLIIYPKENLFTYLTLKKTILFFESVHFLIFLHIFFQKSFFSFTYFKVLLNVCSKNSKIELIQLMLHSHDFVAFFDEALYTCLYTFKKIL